MSSMRSSSCLPASAVPLRPIAFRMLISPPSSLISRGMAEIRAEARVFNSHRRAALRVRGLASLGVFLQPTPETIQMLCDFALDRRQLRRGQMLPCRRPALREEVVLDLRLGA